MALDSEVLYATPTGAAGASPSCGVSGLTANLTPSIRPWVLGQFRDDGGGSNGVYCYRVPRVATAPAGIKEAFFQHEFPSTLTPGVAVFWYVTFSTGAAGAGNAGTIIDFKIEYTIAKIEAGAFPVTGTLVCPGTVNGTNWYYDKSAEATLAAGLAGPCASILLRVYRDNAVDTFPSDNAWVVSMGWHV